MSSIVQIKKPISNPDTEWYDLPDCIKCTVDERLNMSFEISLTYPAIGENFDIIQPNAWLLCKPDPYSTAQSFIIYFISKPINGIVTVRGEHKFYSAANALSVGRTEYSSGTTANELTAYLNYEITDNPIAGSAVFFTDIPDNLTAEWKYDKPVKIKQIMADAAALYGGMWRFNNDYAYLEYRRGSDNGFTVAYGVNAVTTTTERNLTQRFSHVCPFWTGTVITGSGANETMQTENVFCTGRYVEVNPDPDFFNPYLYDVSDKFITKPTSSELINAANAFISDSAQKRILTGKELTVSVDFAALKKTAEYINDNTYSANDDRVQIGDGVTVYTRYNESETLVCTGAVYDVLRDRYNSIELGYLPQRTRAVRKSDYISAQSKTTAYTIADSLAKTQSLEYDSMHPEEKIPDRIVKISDNEVYAIYGNIKETWKADGTGNQRQNFRKILEEVV